MKHCPVMKGQISGGFAAMTDSQKQEIMSQYGVMVASGQHKDANSQNRDQLTMGGDDLRDMGGASTASSQNGDVTTVVRKRNATPAESKPSLMGCPFFNREITDP